MNLRAGRPGDYIGEPGQTQAADECQGIEGSSGEERFRNRGPRRAIPSCNRANDARTLGTEAPGEGTLGPKGRANATAIVMTGAVPEVTHRCD